MKRKSLLEKLDQTQRDFWNGAIEAGIARLEVDEASGHECIVVTTVAAVDQWFAMILPNRLQPIRQEPAKQPLGEETVNLLKKRAAEEEEKKRFIERAVSAFRRGEGPDEFAEREYRQQQSIKKAKDR